MAKRLKVLSTIEYEAMVTDFKIHEDATAADLEIDMETRYRVPGIEQWGAMAFIVVPANMFPQFQGGQRLIIRVESVE